MGAGLARLPVVQRAERMAPTKKFLSAAALVAAGLLIGLSLSGCGLGRNDDAPEGGLDPVVAATVNGRPIYIVDVRSYAVARGMLQEEVLRICAETRQTVFMITHDVDEAILLADKIILMTNGPYAKIAEIVVNTLPRDRNRHDLHRHPHYYRIRNHLIEFLVDRSRAFVKAGAMAGYDPRKPPLTRPGLEETVSEATVPSVARTSRPVIAIAN